MVVKVLGTLDLISALLFFLSAVFSFIPQSWILIIGLYVLVKGIVFAISKDYASFIDIACGTVILISLTISIHIVIVALVCLYLIQKGVISWL